MLGILRFFLASCVILFHLSGQAPGLGQFSVNFFYVLSGFLMTLVLQQQYQFDWLRFSLNRFLRLYPTYFFFLTIGALVIFFGPDATKFHPCWTKNFLSGDVLGNILIFPWAFLSDHAVSSPLAAFTDHYPAHVDGMRFRIVTSSWSVAVEIVCYFLLWLFVARNRLCAALSFIVAAAYHFYVVTHFGSLEMTYFPIFAALLPFSCGACGYFLLKEIEGSNLYSFISSQNPGFIFLVAVTLFLLNWWGFYLFLGNSWYFTFYYINTGLALLVTMIFINCSLSKKGARMAQLLGDLSYPIFLSQYFGGYLAWMVLGREQAPRGWFIFILGYIFSLGLSLIAVRCIDRPLTILRDQVRKNQLKQATRQSLAA